MASVSGSRRGGLLLLLVVAVVMCVCLIIALQGIELGGDDPAPPGDMVEVDSAVLVATDHVPPDLSLPPDQDSCMAVLDSLRGALEGLANVEQRIAMFGTLAADRGDALYDGATFLQPCELNRLLANVLPGTPRGGVVGPLRVDDRLQLFIVTDVGGAADTSLRAQQIYLEAPEGDRADSVRMLAHELAKRARAGESFEQLVRHHTSEQSSAGKDGDLGYFCRGAMVQPFEDSCFKAPNGSIVGPIRTQFGFHIVRIKSRDARLYKLRSLSCGASGRSGIR